MPIQSTSEGKISLAKGIIFTKIGLANGYIFKLWAAPPYPKFSREPPVLKLSTKQSFTLNFSSLLWIYRNLSFFLKRDGFMLSWNGLIQIEEYCYMRLRNVSIRYKEIKQGSEKRNRFFCEMGQIQTNLSMRS